MLIDHDTPLADEIDALGRAPAKRNGNPEMIAQRAVVAYLRRVLPHGSKVASIVNEAKGNATSRLARARYGRARKKSGVISGMPDLVCVLPAGRVLWIEMKRPKGGQLSEDQQDVHRDMSAIGHQVGCATCIETARHLMVQWGIPLREAAGQPMRLAKVRLAKRRPSIDDPIPL